MKKQLFVITIFLILGMPQVLGVALGVNRATVNFVDVLRNGYAQEYITVSTDTSSNISLEYQFTGDIADWMRIEPVNESQLIFSSQRPLRITVIAEPPEDAANGVYEGRLRLLTGKVSETQGQYGSAIRASFGVKIRIEITGDEIRACTAGGFEISDTETGYPLDIQATIQNTGNVRHSPTLEVDIWNQYQTEIVRSFTINPELDILPTTQQTFLNRTSAGLGIGQYWASITEPTCGDSSMVTFSVLDLGGISDKGELLRIDNELWANTDDIIRIAAVFKNLGSRVVNAKFTGTIEKDEKVVEVIETDALNVRPGITEHLETFFNPTEPGRYVVKGRVIYNGKLTFQKSSALNVQGDVAPRVTGNFVQRILKNPYQTSMVVIVMVIGLLLFLIHKERRKRRRPY